MLGSCCGLSGSVQVIPGVAGLVGRRLCPIRPVPAERQGRDGGIDGLRAPDAAIGVQSDFAELSQGRFFVWGQRLCRQHVRGGGQERGGKSAG